MENSCEKTLVQYGDNHGFIPENRHFMENSCEKTLVQYGDNHGFIPEKVSYCFQLASNHIYARTYNMFKQ